MVPVSGRLQLMCQQAMELISHADNPLGHRLNIPFPLLEQHAIIQDKRHLDPKTGEMR